MSQRCHRAFLSLLTFFLLLTAVTCKPRSQADAGAKSENQVGDASFYRPGNRKVSWEGRDRFLGDVQPVLASRCVACHGCTDAPCSAKFTNYELTARGASGANPYGTHAGDVQFPQPRVGAKGFYPTIGKGFNDSLMALFVQLGHGNTTEKDPNGPFNTTATDTLRKKYLTKPKYECPADIGAFKAYASRNPMAGMPFGLPKLEGKENQDLLTWIAETGGQGPTDANRIELAKPSHPDVIFAWEGFLNQAPSVPVRSTLMARYLYEHWFNAHIAFDEMPGEFFRIVRTTEANTGRWSDPTEIVTELPTDDPKVGTKQLYYRFKKVTEVVAQKAHVVFELSKTKMDGYETLFISKERPWNVTKLPGYDTSSPFENFKEIPEDIRHIFMLEHSRFIVDSMVRGPVCVGESATYAIADHFWVFFLKPTVDPSSGAGIKMSKEGFDGLNLDVKAWLPSFQVSERFVNNYNYMIAYEDALRADLKRRGKTGLTLDDLWHGEALRAGGTEHDRNAWLSITRHDISTTVQYGVRGGMPQSSWILTYANFERLYYNLVVNFKYWGAAMHKVGTWRSMSHERMDGEDLFLSLLPPEARNKVRMDWSGGLELGSDLASLGSTIAPIIKMRTGVDINAQRSDGEKNKPIKRYIDLYPLQSLRDTPRTGISISGNEDPAVLMERLVRDRMSAAQVSPANDPLNARSDGESIYTPAATSAVRSLPPITDFESFEKALAVVGRDRGIGRYAAWLPATTIARVGGAGVDARVYSFVGNRAYLSHNLWALSSSEEAAPARKPQGDTVSIYKGVVGDRPELFLDIPLESQSGKTGSVGAKEFLDLVQRMNNENHAQIFTKIYNDYAIQRNSSKFWPFYDWLHKWMIHNDNTFGPGIVYAGILDLLRYDPPAGG